MEETRFIVTGRVQRVMYRDFVRRSASKLGISGYVRNLDDGSVEVVAQGADESLEVLSRRLHEGALLSRVERVESERRTAHIVFDRFEIAL